LLPAAIAALPGLVEVIFPRSDVAEVAVAVVAPIIAALLRSTVGWGQLQRLCGEPVPRHRQIALAVAIVLLMSLEGLTAMLSFADDEPRTAWTAPAVLYIAYLVAIAYALRTPAIELEVD
jgi:hypothetical protein